MISHTKHKHLRTGYHTLEYDQVPPSQSKTYEFLEKEEGSVTKYSHPKALYGIELTLFKVATTSIKSGETLFTIPRKALLTYNTNETIKACPSMADVKEWENPWNSLIFALLLETNRAAQSESKWQPYLDILPSQAGDFNTLMFWDDNELQASAVRSKIGRIAAEDSFRSLLPRIHENRAAFGFAEVPDSQLEKELMNRAHVLASVIMAYAFDVEPFPREKQPDEEGYVTDDEEEDLPKAMVPLADMLNADADQNNARLFYEDDGTLEMRAVQDIAMGDEIFNDYGPLPRSELLRRYGYITDNYARYDVVEISTSLFLDAAKEMYGTEDEEILQKVGRTI